MFEGLVVVSRSAQCDDVIPNTWRESQSQVNGRHRGKAQGVGGPNDGQEKKNLSFGGR